MGMEDSNKPSDPSTYKPSPVAGLSAETARPNYIYELEDFMGATAWLRTRLSISSGERAEIIETIAGEERKPGGGDREEVSKLRALLREEIFAEQVSDKMLEDADDQVYRQLNNEKMFEARLAFKRLIKLIFVRELGNFFEKHPTVNKRVALEKVREKISALVTERYSNIPNSMKALEDINFDDVFEAAEYSDKIQELISKYDTGNISDDEQTLLLRINKAAKAVARTGGSTLLKSIPEEYHGIIESIARYERKKTEDRLSGPTGSMERFSSDTHNPLEVGNARRPRRYGDNDDRF